MKQENTSLDLYQKQQKAELMEKVLKLINEGNFEMDSLSEKEVTSMSEIIKEIFKVVS